MADGTARTIKRQGVGCTERLCSRVHAREVNDVQRNETHPPQLSGHGGGQPRHSIQDIAKAGLPLPPAIESGLWYQYYFQTERGRAGLTAHRRELARTLWVRNSPTWRFDEATLDRHASAFDNPDYVDVVIHSYRHRLGLADGYSPYADVERRLAALPAVTVPTITLDGTADGVVPATDGSSSASKFSGSRAHRVVEDAGHNLPEEAPREFADAVWALASATR